MTDIVLETVRAAVLMGIVMFLLSAGRNRFEHSRKGWNLIIVGFGLLMFGSVLDITDNFESLNSFVVIGDTEVEAFLEKFVGFLGGFVFIAIGLFNWIPGVQGLSDLVDSQTRELRDKDKFFSHLLASSPVILYARKIGGDYGDTYISDNVKEIMGFEPSYLMQNPGIWEKNIHPEDAPRVSDDLIKLFEDGKLAHEYRIRKYDGSYVWVQDKLRLIYGEDGEPTEIIGSWSDVSERKQAEKIKSEFISTVSHELRTPLTSIKGAIGLIRAGAAGQLPDKLQTMLDIAYKNSDRLVLLINDILDMEKIEAGRMDFHMRPTEVVSLVEEAINANKGYGDAHGVIFVKETMEQESLVRGDKDRLMQVMANLMSNAAKFSSQGEKIEISITREDGTVRIAVKDHGPGIPRAYQESIFEKFTQVDSSDTRKKGGTGLGLSISAAIVEQHGGAIGFESEEGRGSTFFFTLPVTQ